MSAIVHGIMGGAIATALAAVSLATQREVAVERSGWKRLRPGWYIHLALAGCIIFVALISFFFLTGGSARRDDEEQNFYALLLMIAFGIGGLWTVVVGYGRRVEWRGETIRSAPLAREKLSFSEFVDVGTPYWSEAHVHRRRRRCFGSAVFHGSRNVSRRFPTLNDASQSLRRWRLLNSPLASAAGGLKSRVSMPTALFPGTRTRSSSKEPYRKGSGLRPISTRGSPRSAT